MMLIATANLLLLIAQILASGFVAFSLLTTDGFFLQDVNRVVNATNQKHLVFKVVNTIILKNLPSVIKHPH